MSKNETPEGACPPTNCSACAELRQEVRHLKDQLATLSRVTAKEKRKLGNMVEARERTLAKIVEVLQPAASNRRFMQIAGPAHQCINAAKMYLPNE